MGLKRNEIEKAIRHKGWQKFRHSLKCKPTTNKIVELENFVWAVEYVDSLAQSTYMTHWEEYFGKPPTREQARVQILNYLNALARGGQIEPLPKQEWTFDELGKLLRHELLYDIQIRK